MKKSSILSQTEAKEAVQAALGHQWTVSDSGLEKTYQFHNYEDANNFLIRYNSYCEKVNAEPQWSNVYNTVSVALKCAEIGEITHKDLSIAKYLDMVHTVSMNMDKMLDAKLHEKKSILLTMDGAKNDQYKSTAIVEKDYLRLAE